MLKTAWRYWFVAGLLLSAPPIFADERDPLVRINRPIYRFNDALDRRILLPLTRGYVWLLPQPARDCVHNVFSNLGDTLVVVNDVLQVNPRATGRDFLRLVMNTTFGLAGLFDVGVRVGLPKHEQDFGLTLGVWGVPAGPYVVLPIKGPSTLRDAPAALFDTLLYPLNFIRPSRDQWGPYALYVVDMRAQLLPLQPTLESSGDPYILLREVYLQRRAAALKADRKAAPSDQTAADDPFTADGSEAVP